MEKLNSIETRSIEIETAIDTAAAWLTRYMEDHGEYTARKEVI